ncbi:MAG: polysaccharide deacetylase family protein, partial [Xanthobacteraceae bacterium]
MRLAAIASALAIILCAAVFGTIFLQRTSVSGPTAPALAAPGEGQAPAIGTSARADAMKAAVVEQTEAPTVVAQAGPAPAATTCSNPNALGIARTVEIDTTGGPGFGFEHFKSHDFLREGEVVLTFDDGPWPKNT